MLYEIQWSWQSLVLEIEIYNVYDPINGSFPQLSSCTAYWKNDHHIPLNYKNTIFVYFNKKSC